jgi:hypothetical protein
VLLNGKRHALALLAAALLEGGRGAEGGVEGDVIGLVAGRARLDIATVLALGLRQGPAPGVLAGQFIQRGIQLARLEGLAGPDLLAALPPVGVGMREDVLLRRLGFRLLRTLLSLILEL